MDKQTTRNTMVIPFALQLGFFAGLIWGGIHVLFYYMNFTQLPPSYLAEPFFLHSFMSGTGGYMVGWAFFIGFSIFCALFYALIFKSVKGPWLGVIYGIVWYVFLFYLFGPFVGMMPMAGKMSYDTYIVHLCLFVLWGMFIGYTVALEYTDERLREPATPNLG